MRQTALVVILSLGLSARASGQKVVLPLDDKGAVSLSSLVQELGEVSGIPTRLLEVPEIKLPVRGLTGALGRTFLAEALGPRYRLSLLPEAIEVSWDDAGARGDINARLEELALLARSQAVREMRYGMRARASYQPSDASRPTVCLVHGMNSSSGGFVHLIPLIEAEGFGVVVYDYPYNRDLDESSAQFARDWREFREKYGEKRPWVLLSHSMGGLLARAYVEGDLYGDDVSDLILLAPPNQGSAVAEMQSLMQWIQASQALGGRSSNKKTPDNALPQLREGLGAAVDDLLPGSKFLKTINGRARRDGVKYHILAGNQGFLDAETRDSIQKQLDTVRRAGGLFGGLSRLALGNVTAALDEVSDKTGDGCVAVSSTRLEGVAEHRIIPANHVEIIRGPLLFPESGPVACWPVVQAWLKQVKQ